MQILFPDRSIFYGKSFVLVSATEGTPVVGASQSGLKENTEGFAGWSDTGSHVMETLRFGVTGHKKARCDGKLWGVGNNNK